MAAEEEERLRSESVPGVQGVEPTFWYLLGLSFVVGSVWVTLSTVAAETLGSKIGGIIAGLPSTVVVALLFIALTQTPLIAAEATTVMVATQGINGAFVVAFVALARRGLGVALSVALSGWSILASGLVISGLRSFPVAVAIWIACIIGGYGIVEKWIGVRSQAAIPIRYTAIHVASRAIFGGAVIAFAVLMAKLAGPHYGGVFAAFPAIFVSTLVILHRTGGADFCRAVGKALMVSGMVNVGVYVIAVRYSYPAAGWALGTVIALFVSGASGYLTYRFVRSATR